VSIQQISKARYLSYGVCEIAIRDGLLKLKDFPHGFGGSGIEVAE
jgi:hypothetical protein